MSKIQSPEELMNNYPQYPTLNNGEAYFKDAVKLMIKEAQHQAVEYTLEQAAKNVKLTEFASEFLQEGSSGALDKESILSLKDRILKDLKV